MNIVEFLLFFSLLLIIVFLGFYIIILGRMGFQFFKYNFPMFKKRGAFYLLWLRNGRFKLIYGGFKPKWKWPDGTESAISRNFDRIIQSTEPLIFLVEGFPTNVRLGDLMPKEEMSTLINNIIKSAYSTGIERGDLEVQKDKSMSKWIFIGTLGVSLLTLVIVVFIFMNLGQINSVIEEFQPFIPQAIEWLSNAPRELASS